MAKKSLKALLSELKVQDEAIKTILGENDHEIEIDDNINILTSEDKDTLIKNSNKEATKAAREILIKEMKTMAGIEFEGKTPEKFIENYKAHVMKESNITIDERIKEKDQMVNDLRAKLTEKDNDYSKLNETLASFKTTSLIKSALPKNRDTKLSDDDYLTLINSSVKIVEEDGNQVVTYNGKKLQDDKLNPLPLDKAFETIFNEKKWVVTEDNKRGAGFGDSGRVPNQFNKLSEIREWANKEGKSLLDSEVKLKLQEVSKANPNFVYD